MRRWALLFALFVSAGLNAGILATLWVTRRPPPARPVPPPAAVDARAAPASSPAPANHAAARPVESAPALPVTPERPAPGGPASKPAPDPPLRAVPPSAVSLGDRAVLPPAPPRLLDLAERVGLAGEEKKKFIDLQLRLMVAVRDGRWRIQQLRREVHIGLLGAQPDRRRIETRLDEIAGLQLAMERKTAETVLASRGMLAGDGERVYLEFFQRMRLFGGASAQRPGLGPGAGPRRMPEPGLGPERPNHGLEPGSGLGPDPGEERPRLGRRPRRPGPLPWRLEQRRRRLEQWRRWQEPAPGPPGGQAPPQEPPPGAGGQEPPSPEPPPG